MSGQRNFATLKQAVEANPERRVRLEGERQFVRGILGANPMPEDFGSTAPKVASPSDVDAARRTEEPATGA